MSADRQTAEKAVIDRAVAEMRPDLREHYTAICRIFATTTTSDVRARHRIGGLVFEIKRLPDRYGARAVPVLAQALARSEATLYRYAAVAEAWPGDALDEVLLLRLPGGEPVSWSHLIEIAAMPPAQRADLLRKVARRGLSVRETREEVAKLEHGPLSSSSASGPLPPAFAKVRKLTEASATLEQMVIDDALVEEMIAASWGEGMAIVVDSRAAQLRLLGHIKKNLAYLKRAEGALRRSTDEPVTFFARGLAGALSAEIR